MLFKSIFSFKPIPHSPKRDNVIAVFAEISAQHFDIGVYRALIAVIIVTPYFI